MTDNWGQKGDEKDVKRIREILLWADGQQTDWGRYVKSMVHEIYTGEPHCIMVIRRG